MKIIKLTESELTGIIKRVITESRPLNVRKKPIKRFDRTKIIYGKYGKAIEDLASDYVSGMGDTVCDVVCAYVETQGKGQYIVLVMTSHDLSSSFESKLTEFIGNFIPTNIWVVANTIHGCHHVD